MISVDLYSALMSYSQYEGRGRGFGRVRQGGGGLGRDGEPHKILQPKFHLWHHAIMHAQTHPKQLSMKRYYMWALK